MEKLILEYRKLAEQLDTSKNILEVSEIQQKSGINFSMESNAQTRFASIQTSPFFKIILEGGKDAQFTNMINNNAQVKQNRFAIQMKEIQTTKHQQYLECKSQLNSKESRSTVEEEHQPAHSTKQQQNKMKIHTNKKGTFQHNMNLARNKTTTTVNVTTFQKVSNTTGKW